MINTGHSLNIYLDDKIIAELTSHEGKLHWKYSEYWKIHGYQISPFLFLDNEISSYNIENFLRNMMPEGHPFDVLLSHNNLSKANTFAIIRALGLDTPGALVLLPNSLEYPKTGTFHKVSDHEIANRLINRENQNLIVWNGKPRLSVAGVQDKINVVINNNDMGFGEGLLCSTHILKFAKQNSSELILNEYVSLKLAKSCQISTAEVQIIYFGTNPALLIKRFDRQLITQDYVQRKHIIDGCQALNLPPEYKYERNFGSGRDVAHIREGASLPKIFEFANQCANPALTKQMLLDWSLFNLLIYNFDAHGKNISFYVTKNGLHLAPFYDLLNIKLHPEFSQEMAMAFGDEFAADDIMAYQLVEFALDCNLKKSFVAERLKIMCNKLLDSISKIDIDLNDLIKYRIYIDNYKKQIVEHCNAMLKQSQLMKMINL